MLLVTLSTSQPWLKQCGGLREHTTMLTEIERLDFVKDLASGKLGVLPLCIDHAGGDDPNNAALRDGEPFEVPGYLIIGRVVHGIVRPNGQLLTVNEHYHERPETKAIIKDLNSGRAWGVSLCTNLVMKADMTKIYSKKVTHVGVTRDPEYGDHNTWIHLAATNWPAFYAQLAELIVREPGWYMSDALLEQVMPYVADIRKKRADVEAAATPMVQQVSASRHRASETAPRLGGAGPLTRPQYSLASSSLRRAPRPATMSDPMATPTATPTVATPTATPGSTSVTILGGGGGSGGSGLSAPRLSRDEVVRNGQLFMKELAEKANGNFENLPITPDYLKQSERLLSNMYDYIKQERLSENVKNWGNDILDTIMELRQYQDHSVRRTNEFIDSFYGDDVAVKEAAKAALNNPILPDNLPLVSQVMATRNAALVNQGQKEEQIRKATADLKLREEEVAKKTKEIEEFRKAMEEAKKKETLLIEQLQHTTRAAASGSTSNSNSAIEPETKRPRADQYQMPSDTVSIDTAASTHSRSNTLTLPNLPNARLITPSHNRFDKYVPTASPIVDSFVQRGYLAPWRDDALQKRIATIAGSNQ